MIPSLLREAALAVHANSLGNSARIDLSNYLIRRAEERFRGKLNGFITADPEFALDELLRMSLGEGEYGFTPRVERHLVATILSRPDMLIGRHVLAEAIDACLHEYMYRKLTELANG